VEIFHGTRSENNQEQVENQYVQEVRDEGVWEGDGGVAGRDESL
jgi:hypothetical protein